MESNKFLELVKMRDNVQQCIDNLIEYAENTKEEVDNFFNHLVSYLKKDE